MNNLATPFDNLAV